MIKSNITIINKLGLHARAAAKLVTLAMKYESIIEIEFHDRKINGKSIMGVMMLAASKGTQLVLHTEGNDEQQAAEAIEQLVNNRFDEEN